VLVPDERQSIGRAVAQGAVSAAQALVAGTDTLPVSVRSADALGVSVAEKVLATAGVAAHDVGLVVRSWMVETATDWKAAPRMARLVGADRAVAVGLQQMSNGGAMAVQVAVSHLLTEPRTGTALVVTADALGPDSVRRWQLGETGAALGDGATALVLSSDRKGLAVLSVASSSRPEQENAFPEGNPLLSGPGRTGAFSGQMVFRLRRCVREAVRAACADADLEPDDPRLAIVMLPRIESSLVRVLIDGVLEIGATTEVLHLADATGHLFAGDLAANLAHLMDKRLLAPGELALVLNVGGGFTATCVVVAADV
jgi:3-oxoacyl-[acyl-carrier-protein] synthase-3